MSETATLKDISDVHQRHGREALRAALEAKAAAALDAAEVPLLKSEISVEMPAAESAAHGVSTDRAF